MTKNRYVLIILLLYILMKQAYSMNVKVKNPNKILNQQKVSQNNSNNKLELSNNLSTGKT